MKSMSRTFERISLHIFFKGSNSLSYVLLPYLVVSAPSLERK